MTSNIDIFSDAEADIPATGELTNIGSLVKRATDLQEEIDALEATLSDRKGELLSILNQQLPDVMDGANCKRFETPDGLEVKIVDVVSATIPKDRADGALSWLRENGHGSLVKREIKVSLGRGKDNEAGELKAIIHDQFGLDPEDKETVHPQTLSAFCREQLANGKDPLPANLFSVFIGRQAKIQPKGSNRK